MRFHNEPRGDIIEVPFQLSPASRSSSLISAALMWIPERRMVSSNGRRAWMCPRCLAASNTPTLPMTRMPLNRAREGVRGFEAEDSRRRGAREGVRGFEA
jgi:hypothetical protein